MSPSKSDQKSEVTDDGGKEESELDSQTSELMEDDDYYTSDEDDGALHLSLGTMHGLYDHVYAYMSIESVKLKIKDKAKGPRNIYGEIKVITGRKDKCIYIYHRHGYEAEQVPEVDDDDDSGFDLTLCGPNHPLVAHDVGTIEVALYEKGAPQPFLTRPFYLRHETLGWGKFGEPITVGSDLPDDLGGGRLSLCFTRFLNSIPARFQFLVTDDSEAGAEASGELSEQRVDFNLTVEGTIKAKHIIPGGDLNWLTIFNSSGRAVNVPSGEPIPLPRSVFVMSVRGDGIVDKEGSLKIVADLKVVQPHDDGGEYFIKGETEIVLHKSYTLQEPYYFTLKDSSLKRKHGGSLQLKISVTPEHDFRPEEDKEYLIHA